jgi:ribosomal protein S18 acetylase RimI-like enzyme
MIEIRGFTPAEIPFALEQTTREGWITCAAAFESYLEHDPEGCFIAWRDDEPAGMITTTRYATTAWIGNLIVPPRLRSRGIGRRLMERALRHLQASGVGTIRLDGDPPGLELYRSLGFQDEGESLRFRRRSEKAYEVRGVEPLAPGELKDVLAFDASRFGDDRSRLLEMLYLRSKEAWVTRRGGRVGGYLLTEDTELGLRIGPCVALDAQVARGLLERVLDSAGGRVITLGLPEANRAGRELVGSLGFRPVPSCRRMVLGQRVGEGVPESIFAIGGGAIG